MSSKKDWKNEKDVDRLEKFGKIRKRARKTPKSANLAEEFEIPEKRWLKLFGEEAFAARVVEVHKRYAFISTEKEVGNIDTRDVWLATVARKFLVAERSERNFVTVGDRVLCTPSKGSSDTAESDLPRCVIHALSPRRSMLSRLDPQRPERRHVLASNIDRIIIVASYLKPKVKWGLIDRYLVLAESEDIEPIIVLNKRDLLEKDTPFYRQCEEMEKIYRDLGYEVLSLQADGGEGKEDSEMQRLQEMLVGKVSIFSGHSGVGKSSIVNLFGPEIEQMVEENDDIFYKGRHTTTFASFLKLETGGYVVDTPGIRSFTFEPKTALELTYCFRELRPYRGRCRYRKCRHIDEPECAVKQALEEGKISKWRYRSYLGILTGSSGREGRLRDTDIAEDQ